MPMKRETKLWVRKHALMALRAIVWHIDEWIQRQEVNLRERIEPPGVPVCVPLEPARIARQEKASVSCPVPFPEDEFLRHRVRGRIPRSGEPQRATQTFEQWEMRKSGMRPITKHVNHRRHRRTAAEFDTAIAQRAKEYVQ
jgi:hypothetical protein